MNLLKLFMDPVLILCILPTEPMIDMLCIFILHHIEKDINNLAKKRR